MASSTVSRSYEEINAKIMEGRAVVMTAEEIISFVREKGIKEAAKAVDVVTTGTFGAMCSSGAFLNFGHSDPPIKMTRVRLNDVPAYAGLAAVDAYIGATELSETEGMKYGGAHVIEDLVSGKKVRLYATAYGTDCYPRREIETLVSKDELNQAFLFNPRNSYQNYAAATNSGNRTLYTYMGVLLPRFGNVTYSSAGQLSPLLNDPEYRTIGVGTSVFLAGARGFVAWAGTQHNPDQVRGTNRIPLGPAGTLAVIGDLKQMSRDFIRAAVFERYGTTLYIGIGVPIPILDEEMMEFVSVSDADIYTSILDYGVQRRTKPIVSRVSYQELRSGYVSINGRKVKTGPLSSYAKAREIACILKKWILEDKFTLTSPVHPLPRERSIRTLEENAGDGPNPEGQGEIE